MTRAESFDYFQSLDSKDMLDVQEITIALPAKAKLFDSYTRECCCEETGANWIRIMGGKKVCLDCYETYSRFDVRSEQ